VGALHFVGTRGARVQLNEAPVTGMGMQDVYRLNKRYFP